MMTLPARASFNHRGAAPAAIVHAVVDPAAVRRWNVIPFEGVTKIAAFAAPGVRSLRIISPAFVHASTFSTSATRATIAPSPDHDWYTNWNASDVPQMSAPAPLIVNTLPASDALPAMPVGPMSPDCHGAGT